MPPHTRRPPRADPRHRSDPSRPALQAVTQDRAALDIAKMAPLGDRILVRPKEAEKKSAGGIILATASSANPMSMDNMVGEVIAVGGKVKAPVSKGDMIIYGKQGTADVELKDGKVTFVVEASIMARLS